MTTGASHGRDPSVLAAWLADQPAKAGKTALPEAGVLEQVVRQVAPTVGLEDRFIRAARAAGCEVHEAGERDWPAAIVRIVAAASAREVIVATDAATALDGSRSALLCAALQQAGQHVLTCLSDTEYFAAGVAVTGVTLAVAETGSLIVACSGPTDRRSSLVPPVHVAVVGMWQIVPDLCDVLARSTPAENASLVIITGPSKTADIEGVLVRGVHGPGTVHVVLLRR